MVLLASATYSMSCVCMCVHHRYLSSRAGRFTAVYGKHSNNMITGRKFCSVAFAVDVILMRCVFPQHHFPLETLHPVLYCVVISGPSRESWQNVCWETVTVNKKWRQPEFFFVYFFSPWVASSQISNHLSLLCSCFMGDACLNWAPPSHSELTLINNTWIRLTWTLPKACTSFSLEIISSFPSFFVLSCPFPPSHPATWDILTYMHARAQTVHKQHTNTQRPAFQCHVTFQIP